MDDDTKSDLIELGRDRPAPCDQRSQDYNIKAKDKNIATSLNLDGKLNKFSNCNE